MAAEVAKSFHGKWKLDRSENFDDFLKEVGVNVVIRKVASAGHPTQDIKVEGDTIEITVHTGFWDNKVSFKFGEEYDMTTQGVKLKCLARWEDNAIKIALNPVDKTKGKPQRTERTLADGEMTMTMYIGDVVCKRIFKKVE